jgi:hypothetical protein
MVPHLVKYEDCMLLDIGFLFLKIVDLRFSNFLLLLGYRRVSFLENCGFEIHYDFQISFVLGYRS